MSKEYNTDEFYVTGKRIIIKKHDAIAKLKNALAKNFCSIADVDTVVVISEKADEESLNDLADFLASNPQITVCYYETHCLRLFANLVLQENSTIKSLYFEGDFSVDSCDAEALSKVFQHNKTLKDLYFDSRKTDGQIIDDTDWSTIFQGLEKNTTIEKLSIERHKMGQNAVDALSKTLQNNKTLAKLYLRNCAIGDDGINTLVDNGLEGNSTIKKLKINYNVISAVGAKKLSEFLEGNSSIRTFDISENQIKDEGLIAISKALRGNSSLKKINLGFNEIGDSGIQAFSKVLKDNNTLEQLHLNYNEIGNSGIENLSDALEGNNTLQILYIGNNIYSDSAVALIINKVLKGNESLIALDLSKGDGIPLIKEGITNLLIDVLPNTNIQCLHLSQFNNEKIQNILKNNFSKHGQQEAEQINIIEAGDGSPNAVGASDVSAEEGSDQVDLTGSQYLQEE